MERVLVVGAFLIALLLPAPFLVDATYGCAGRMGLQAVRHAPAAHVGGCAGR